MRKVAKMDAAAFYVCYSLLLYTTLTECAISRYFEHGAIKKDAPYSEIPIDASYDEECGCHSSKQKSEALYPPLHALHTISWCQATIRRIDWLNKVQISKRKTLATKR